MIRSKEQGAPGGDKRQRPLSDLWKREQIKGQEGLHKQAAQDIRRSMTRVPRNGKR